MKEIQVTKYQAFDGKIFDLKIDCFHHEFLEKFKEEIANEIINDLSEQTLREIGLMIISKPDYFIEILATKKNLLLEAAQNEPF